MTAGEKKYQDDKELLDLYLAGGNNEYLGSLLQRYSLLLFGVCMKYLGNTEEAKDAVQQVFLKVLRDISKYKVENFRSWLYMVAKNHCLMALRKKGIRLSEIDERTMGAAGEEDLRDLLREKEEQFNRLTEALHALNEPQQACIRLFYLEKKSYREIASVTGFSELQVKSHIQNGKRNLKIYLERKKIMKDDLNHISPEDDPGRFRQRLEDYLGDRMPPGERNAFEQEMTEDPFWADAAEGIELSGTRNLPSLELEIHKGLKRKLNRNRRKSKKAFDWQPGLVAAILILLLLLVSYLVIRKII